MLELKNISKKYNFGKPNETAVLSDISLAVNDGDYISVMGRSGAGKSTLLHILSLLDKPTRGEYFFDGVDTAKLTDSQSAKYRSKKIGILLQDFRLLESETVIKNVMSPLYFSDVPFSKMKQTAFDALEKIGISGLSKQIAGTLSGGEKQRAALARAIVNSPSVLLADEPTGALDSKNRDLLMDIISELNQQKTTVIIVTHDPEVAKRCEKNLLMNDGRFSEQARL